MELEKKNMNNKKNIDAWIEYVIANWLNRKTPVCFRPSTERLVHKMRMLSLDPSSFGDAWHYVEEIEKLQSRFHDETGAHQKESPQMLLECGIASYKMGNSREAIRFINGAIGFYTEYHDKAAARWLLGCVYWHLEDEVDALSAWENAIQDFGEQAAKIGKNNANELKWYENLKQSLEGYTKYAVDHNAPPFPPPLAVAGNKAAPFNRAAYEARLKLIPYYGLISAGDPRTALDHPVGQATVDTLEINGHSYSIFRVKAEREVRLQEGAQYFLMRADGPSMNTATPISIEDGDYVLLKNIQKAENKDIVAVVIFGQGEPDTATLKSYYEDGGGRYVMSQSNAVTINICMGKDDYIQGVAVAILKPVDA